MSMVNVLTIHFDIYQHNLKSALYRSLFESRFRRFSSGKMGENPENTPGRQAIAVMEDFNKDLIFKTPTELPQRKRKKETILDEDTYVEKIGRIIERDFFPDLDKLKAQNEYLDAVEKNDVTKIRELYRKYSGNQPPLQRLPSPATFETPANIHNSQINQNESNVDKIERSDDIIKDKRLSLDQFLNSHTSQDNYSFNEMLIESEQKHREKYSYLYKEEDKSELERLKQLELPTITQQASDNREKPLNLNIWGYKNKNSIMYIPDGCELTDQERVELTKNRQEVVHSNTRLVQNPFNEHQSKETINELAKTHARVLDGKIGVDGKELLTNQTPQINGFSFVKTPNPNQITDTPLMTWGEIEGTPFRLDASGGNTPRYCGAAFKMSAPGRREQLAIELVEKSSEKNRKQNKQKAIDQARRNLIATPSPYRSERLSVMSPAARRLATNQLKLGLNEFTPTHRKQQELTPKRTPISSNTPKRIVTPKLNLGIKRGADIDNNLTDNLLKIDLPKRQKAADFF